MLEEKLKQLGLNNYEIKAYVALVSSDRDSMHAAELSTASGVPMARIYDIMDSLEKKGFVKIGLGRPALYQSLLPDDALENYRRKMELEFDRKLKDFDRMKLDLSKELSRRKGAKTVSRLKESFSIKEGSDITVSLEKMLSRAKKRVYAANSSRFTIEAYMLAEAARKGVEIKFLGTKNKVPIALCITDDELMVLDCSVKDGAMDGKALWSNSKVLVDLFGWFFEGVSKKER